MWALFFFGLFVASWVWFFFDHRRQRGLVADATKAREKIEVEEGRVFEFLHMLAGAFTDEVHPEHLHGLIVEGATRILNAQGGALYLVSSDSRALQARFISKNCPPLIEMPAELLQKAETSAQTVQDYQRAHSVAAGEGPVGKTWRDKEALLLTDGDARLAQLRDQTVKTTAAMFSPLEYANQNLGVLAVANGPLSPPFAETDFAIFKAVAEQAAFALYNAIVYSQADEKKRLDTDLQIAQDIQRILLPTAAPAMRGYEIDGVNLPARQMSGDYYGYIRIDDHHWGVAIADVSGKGVAASLIMGMCRATLRSHSHGNASAADVLRIVNRQLYPDIKEDMFISMAYVILDDDSNQVTLCRAGHDAPLLYTARDQSVQKLNPPGMALGIDSGGVFDRITTDFSVTLESNDCLILYTDGVTEALDSKGIEFGMKRTIQAIQASAPQGAAAIKKRLTDDLGKFVGNYPQNDDITVIVIRKK